MISIITLWYIHRGAEVLWFLQRVLACVGWGGHRGWNLGPTSCYSYHITHNTMECLEQREREMFYLTTHSTHFIYSYMASDIWLRCLEQEHLVTVNHGKNVCV